MLNEIRVNNYLKYIKKRLSSYVVCMHLALVRDSAYERPRRIFLEKPME